MFYANEMIVTRIVATCLLFFMDLLWIHWVMKSRYNTMIPLIQGGDSISVNRFSAAMAYALMAVGLNAFVIQDNASSLYASVARGMLFGIVLYGVYDFTAGAVFHRWDWNTATMDIAWGGFVYAAVAGMAYGLHYRLKSED